MLRLRKDDFKRRVGLVACILGIRGLLDYSYVAFVAPLFAYSGLVLDYNLAKHVESYALLALMLPLLPTRVKRPSDLLVFIFFLAPIVPTLSLYGLRDEARAPLYLMLAGFFIVLYVRQMKSLKLVWLREGRTLGVLLIFAMVLVVSAIMFAKGGLQSFNLNLNRVYEFRDEATSRYGGVLSYLVIWVTKVFNPALIGWALYKRQRGLLLGLIVLQVLFFGMTSHKSVLFYPALIVGMYWFAEHRYAIHGIGYGLLAVLAVALTVFIGTGEILLGSLFIRRVFFVPAALNFGYFDFFGSRDFVYFSNTFLAPFIDYPYDAPYPQVIGEYLFNYDALTWANNGFLATGYMHLGVLGVMVYAALVGGLLWLTDQLARKLPLWLGMALVIVPFFSLFTSADLPTALLSHGLGISLVVLWLLGARSRSKKRLVLFRMRPQPLVSTR